MDTVADAIALHLADCKFRNLSPKTLQLYEMYEKTFLAFLYAKDLDRSISALNAANVKNAASWLKDKHRGKRGGESAVKSLVATLKILSRFLMDEDVIAYDYLAKVKRPKVVSPVRKPFEPWEIQAIRGALLETRTARRDVAILSLLLDTGLRISELCVLTLRDVDLRAYTVRVMGKGRVERIVPFGDASRNGGKTAARLREYLVERKPQVASERLFLSYDGYPFTAAGFRQAFLGACRRAGVANTSVHTTRHTFATRFLVAHPGDVEQLRFLLGHMSDDTYRVYVRQAGEILAETSERFSIAADLERVHVAM